MIFLDNSHIILLLLTLLIMQYFFDFVQEAVMARVTVEILKESIRCQTRCSFLLQSNNEAK